MAHYRRLTAEQRAECLEETTEAAVAHWVALDDNSRDNALHYAVGRLNTAGMTRREALSTAVRLEWEEETPEGRAYAEEQRQRRLREQQEWRDRPLTCMRCGNATDPRGRLVYGGDGEDNALCYDCVVDGQEAPYTGLVQAVHEEAVQRGLVAA